MSTNKKFRIEFSGKGYPKYRPVAVTILAPDKERASQWIGVQMKHWGLEDVQVKFSIKEVADTTEVEKSEGEPNE
jgi:hypothetical protein